MLTAVAVNCIHGTVAEPGGEWIRVAEEQQRYMTLRDEVEAATVGAEDWVNVRLVGGALSTDGTGT